MDSLMLVFCFVFYKNPLVSKVAPLKHVMKSVDLIDMPNVIKQLQFHLNKN